MAIIRYRQPGKYTRCFFFFSYITWPTQFGGCRKSQGVKRHLEVRLYSICNRRSRHPVFKFHNLKCRPNINNFNKTLFVVCIKNVEYVNLLNLNGRRILGVLQILKVTLRYNNFLQLCSSALSDV